MFKTLLVALATTALGAGAKRRADPPQFFLRAHAELLFGAQDAILPKTDARK